MKSAGSRRVLVVDDEPSICRALTLALGRAGYQVLSAQSGEAALAMLREQAVDVMLADFRIPDLRGDVLYELAASIQPHLRHQTMFVTGDITERVELLIGACGCPFLRKPFDLSDIVSAVGALAPHRRAVSA